MLTASFICGPLLVHYVPCVSGSVHKLYCDVCLALLWTNKWRWRYPFLFFTSLDACPVMIGLVLGAYGTSIFVPLFLGNIFAGAPKNECAETNNILCDMTATNFYEASATWSNSSKNDSTHT